MENLENNNEITISLISKLSISLIRLRQLLLSQLIFSIIGVVLYFVLSKIENELKLPLLFIYIVLSLIFIIPAMVNFFSISGAIRKNLESFVKLNDVNNK